MRSERNYKAFCIQHTSRHSVLQINSAGGQLSKLYEIVASLPGRLEAGRGEVRHKTLSS